MEEIVLHIDDVHKSFAGLHALADVNLDIRQGETHAIIGPNGAGKSTLLNVCIGRLEPTQGKVMFEGSLMPSFYKTEGFVRLGDAYTGDAHGDGDVQPLLTAQQIEDVVAFLVTLKEE